MVAKVLTAFLGTMLMGIYARRASGVRLAFMHLALIEHVPSKGFKRNSATVTISDTCRLAGCELHQSLKTLSSFF